MSSIPEETTVEKTGIHWFQSIPFYAVHVLSIVGVIVGGWSWSGFALAIAFYYVRMFGITGGYHRYFSHRTYKTSRPVQFGLALLGTLATQKGVLWWSAHHRAHHKYSDQPEDVHSVKQSGFFWSHMGWILARKYEDTDWKRIRDFAKYPELVWLNKWHLVPVVAFAAILTFIGGWHWLLWGYFVSTTLLWHGTFTINSLAHLIGRRRYRTTDDSRNSAILALVTIGEGWHNNHHHYQRATNNGFFWWEIDITYYLIKAMQGLRLVWDVHTPPPHVRDRVDAGPVAEVEEPAAEPAATAEA